MRKRERERKKKQKRKGNRLDNNIITFYATENFGPKGGYSGNIMPKIELNVNSVSSVNLSEALKQTFELSTIA